MLEKLTAVILSLIIAAAGIGVVYAAEEKTVLDELKLSLSVDGGYSVITRNTPQEDAIFKNYSLDYRAYMQSLKSSDIYLQAISAKGESILSVTMTKDENSKQLVSYSRLSDEERLTLVESFLKNDIYTSGKIEDINGHFYVYLPFAETVEGESICGIQYNTVENGMNINIALQTAGQPTAEDTEFIRGVVESIAFTEQVGAVSSFSPAVAVIIALAAVAVIAAAILLARLLRKKRLVSSGGFDSPQASPIYSYQRKKKEETERQEQQRRLQAREKVIDRINSGENYDVFKDEQ